MNTIGIIGAGAIGSAIAQALARVGIGATQQRPDGQISFSSP
jgi:tRNA A37 threonylcarbamoyladenosine dehydratase